MSFVASSTLRVLPHLAICQLRMSLDLHLPNHCMFWAACTLGFFWVSSVSRIHSPLVGGFLALGSLGCAGYRSGLQFRPFMHLLKDSCSNHIGRGKYPLCAVHALLAYLVIRGDLPGPLFLCQSGQPLLRTLLTDWLRRIMASAGISGHFSSHSFRIGAATVAGCNGIPDH